MISWDNSFSAALKHRAALAEVAYKLLRLVWNSPMPKKRKLFEFQSVFVSTLIYGLDALTSTPTHLHRIDGIHFGFLRRIVGIKASYYLRVSNHAVWRQANYPQRPSDRLRDLAVFSSAYRDRIVIKGRHRGRKRPYWVETTTQNFFPNRWTIHSRRSGLGKFTIYAEVNREPEKHRASANARSGARTTIAKN